jgi:hypothetical protein
MIIQDIVINNGDLRGSKWIFKKIQCGFDWFCGICSWDFNGHYEPILWGISWNITSP